MFDLGSFTTLAKTAVMLNLRTGNVFLDMFIQTFIVSFLGYLTTFVPMFLEWCKAYFTKRHVRGTVSISTTSKYVLVDSTVKITSNSLYKAVMHALFASLKTSQVQDIMDDDGDANLPPLDVIIQLSPQVSCMFTSDTLEGNSGTSTSAAIKVQRITCRIFSQSLSLAELKTFTEDLRQKHLMYLADLDAKKKKNNVKYMYIYGEPGPDKNGDDGDLNSYALETTRSFDNVFFEQKEQLLSQLDFFTNNHAWYRRVGSPYTLGICLSGPPGTGKTSCIKAIAERTKRNIVIISLRHVKSYKDLIAVFSGSGYGRHGTTSQDIFVIEDIDCVDRADVIMAQDGSTVAAPPIHGYYGTGMSHLPGVTTTATANFKMEKTLTLSDVLNAIDGILEFSGRILVISSNHRYKLDPALLRPGRIDIDIVLDRASLKIVRQIITHFFNLDDATSDFSLLDPRVDGYFTPAEVTCVCKQYMNDTYLHVINHLNGEIQRKA